MTNVFGLLAMLCGMATFLLGLSAQVIKQHKEKRCGISIVFASLGGLTTVVRIGYFALLGAWWTIPPDVVGFVLTLAIFYQYGAYERHWWGDDKK